MADPAAMRIEVLSSAHDRDGFDCGVEPLNIFLKQYALQNQRKNLVRTYVLVRHKKVLGFYSLAFGETKRESAPAVLTKGTGRFAVPSMILARLAVDRTAQGQGLGETLLKNAVLRTKQAAEIAGLRALVVHAKDDNARSFYRKYGFIEALDNPLVLFFPMDAI